MSTIIFDNVLFDRAGIWMENATKDNGGSAVSSWPNEYENYRGELFVSEAFKV